MRTGKYANHYDNFEESVERDSRNDFSYKAFRKGLEGGFNGSDYSPLGSLLEQDTYHDELY